MKLLTFNVFRIFLERLLLLAVNFSPENLTPKWPPQFSISIPISRILALLMDYKYC